ncbi:MAG: glucokinase, partial [Ketobacter sp.]
MQESAHLQQEFVGDMIALLADVGGTKTQLALMNQAGELIAESLVVNADYDCFETVIEQFLRQQPPPTAAVLAVAGPVDNAIRCQMTNLNWLIDGEHLQRHYNLSRVT